MDDFFGDGCFDSSDDFQEDQAEEDGLFDDKASQLDDIENNVPVLDDQFDLTGAMIFDTMIAGQAYDEAILERQRRKLIEELEMKDK